MTKEKADMHEAALKAWKTRRKKVISNHDNSLTKQIDYYIEKENFFTKKKNNAIEKILVREYLIKEKLKELMKKLRVPKNIDISKGVVTTRKNGKLEGSGDCDLIIFEREKGKFEEFDGIVSISDKKCVKAIILINKSISDFKEGVLSIQKRYSNGNIFIVFWGYKRSSSGHIVKKIGDKIKKDDIFVLAEEEKNNFKRLTNKLNKIIKVEK